MDHVIKFIEESGLKVLAQAKLDDCEYSLVLHLLNTAASGHVQWITTVAELGTLVRYSVVQTEQALKSLESRGMISRHYAESNHTTETFEHESMRIGFEFQIHKWRLENTDYLTSQDAVIYPFIRGFSGGEEGSGGDLFIASTEKNLASWETIVEIFVGQQDADDEIKQDTVKESAQLLLKAHPYEQVLLLLEYFGTRIPSLSLMASNWDQFVLQYEKENLQIDFLDARQKHADIENNLRSQAKQYLQASLAEGYSPLEVSLLKLLISHKRPRRQLYWAYQSKERYPRLKDFFEQNKQLMLAVTCTGSIVKKQP